MLQARILALPCPSTGDLPNPGIEPASLKSPALAGRLFITSATWDAPSTWYRLATQQMLVNWMNGKKKSIWLPNRGSALSLKVFLHSPHASMESFVKFFLTYTPGMCPRKHILRMIPGTQLFAYLRNTNHTSLPGKRGMWDIWHAVAS